MKASELISPLIKRAKRVKVPSRPARVRRTAGGRARHEADLKWAQAIRDSGPCAALGYELGVFDRFAHLQCVGAIEAAHIVSRRYAATRHDIGNGLPLCHGAHRFFTEHPRQWEEFLGLKLGLGYDALKAKALRGTK